jgi:hypothetical protein
VWDLPDRGVSAWRVSLEDRGLGSSSIIIRMSAIRKLAAEAADNGLLEPELAAGISRVKSAKTQGIRAGNCSNVVIQYGKSDISMSPGLCGRFVCVAVAAGVVR